MAKKVILAIAGVSALTMPVMVGVMKAPVVSAQTPAENFEVASIRPCRDEPGRRRGAGEMSPGRLNTGCTPLVDEKSLGLIQRAYVRFADRQLHWTGIVPIEGGPSWIRSQLYTINAAAEGNPGPATMQGPMLRALLEERFKLKLHRETREVPVYELTVGDGGHRLKPFQEGSCVILPLTAPRPALPPGQQHCKVMVDIRRPAVSAQGSTLGEFSKLLDLVLDRPVIDKTGISGRFDIRLEFARDEATPGLHGPFANADPSAARSEPDAPSIFAALQQQLGLKFVRGRGPREFIVIDHVERPSEN